MRGEFTEGSIARPILMFSVPLFIANILQQLYGIADSILVGRIIGASGLAAIGASMPIVSAFIASAIGVTLGISVVISHFIGAQKYIELKKIIGTAYIFFLIFSLFLSAIGISAASNLLGLINTPQEIYSETLRYLTIIFTGTLPLLGFNVINAVFRGIGDSITPLIILVISIILNILLDLVFLLIFKFGISGAAWATVGSQIAAFILSIILFRVRYQSIYPRLKDLGLNPEYIIRFLRIGIPSGLKGLIFWTGYVILTSMVNNYGPVAIAAFGAVSKIDRFIQTPLISLCYGVSIFAGQNISAGKPERIKKGLRIIIMVGILFSILISILIIFFGHWIMKIFIADKRVVESGYQYLKIVSPFYIVFALQEIMQGVAIGSGKTWILLLSTITAMWIVRIPLASILVPYIGILGIWVSIPSGWIIAMLFTNWFYFFGNWEKGINDR